MSTQHSYGYIKDTTDERDFQFKAVQKVEQLPPNVDMRKFCSPVRDQDRLGACTGFAIGSGLREFLMLKNLPIPIPPSAEQTGCLQVILSKIGGKNLLRHDPSRYTTLSPLFLYYQERLLEGTISEDGGAEMRTGLKAIKDIGISPEEHHPYIPQNFMLPPNADAYADASMFKISVYSRLIGLNSMKSCLAIGGGIVIGFYVYESFESNDLALTGKMPMPKDKEEILGGHAVFVCGYYDDASWPGGGYLIVKNSWGTGWGDQGYFYMPYEFAKSRLNVPDVWTASV